MAKDKERTKVHINLPNHWATGGESLWVRSLGGDLYEIDNVQFYAYGINYLDVVRATEDAPHLKPSVREVIRPSGHSTIRVSFDKLPRERQAEILEQLKPFDASYERATSSLVAIDITPAGNVWKVRELLDDLEAAGLLFYETCEARVEGSFDDLPSAEE